MLVTLEEAKNYLRIDGEEEDSLVAGLISTSENLCKDVVRADKVEEMEAMGDSVKQAVLYGTAYLYEHRENADYHELTMMLRYLLFGVRKEGF